MQQLIEWMKTHPIVPFIRQCDHAVRPPWNMPERRLLDYLFIFVQEGRCRFTVDGNIYDLGKGDFCLIQPGSLNGLEGLTNTVTPFAHFDVFYTPDRQKSFPTRAGQVDLSAYSHLIQPRLGVLCGVDIPVRLTPGHPVKLRDTFLQVVEYWQYRDPVMQLRAQMGMSEVILSLLEDALPSKPSQRNPPPVLNWITSYFSLHLNEPISVPDMARRANLSTSRFNDLFKQHFGMTPHQYLLDMRVNHACELLQTTELSQEQISSYCGFSDIHHFSKAFKKRMGCAPGAYRLK